jgi:hypothetical protein
MRIKDLSFGQLVRSNIEGPTFHKGALFRVVSTDPSLFIACQAVGKAPFRIWYFRPGDLIRAIGSELNCTP